MNRCGIVDGEVMFSLELNEDSLSHTSVVKRLSGKRWGCCRFCGILNSLTKKVRGEVYKRELQGTSPFSESLKNRRK